MNICWTSKKSTGLEKIAMSIYSQQALGLMEAVVALAIVGIAMVLITQISFKTIKQARKNEMRDVAIQAAVEAMEFMVQPGDIMIDTVAEPAMDIKDSSPHYFSLDFTSTPQIINHGDANFIVADSCTGSSYQLSGIDDFELCQQIKVTYVGLVGGKDKFEVEVRVVWEGLGGVGEESTIRGARIGDFI